MTERLLARALLGPILPRRGDIDEVPEPYRSTVQQSRAAVKARGLKFGEPLETQVASIKKKPTP